MAQNRHTAVIHLGHQNGRVTLWTPNLPHPAVQLLAHLGPVVGLSVDPSTGGRYMASSGADGTVKIWDCRNWKGVVREWSTRSGSAEVEWSAKGALAVATGGSVNVQCHGFSVLFTELTASARSILSQPFKQFSLPKYLHRFILPIQFPIGRFPLCGFAHSKIPLQ